MLVAVAIAPDMLFGISVASLYKFEALAVKEPRHKAALNALGSRIIQTKAARGKSSPELLYVELRSRQGWRARAPRRRPETRLIGPLRIIHTGFR